MPELYGDDVEVNAFALPGDPDNSAPPPAAAEETPAPEAPAAAEPAPAATEEPEAAAPEAATPEAPETPEGETPAVPPAVDDPDVQKYLEKYGGDPAKALSAAVERERLLGRQGQELGELRATVEELARLAGEEREPQPQIQYDTDQLEDWFAANPTRIPQVAAQAFYSNDEVLLEASIAAWEELDKPAARAFDRQVTVMRARQEAAREQTAAAAAAGAQPNADEIRAGWEQTAMDFAEKHPDFEALAGKMREVAPRYPIIAGMLQSPDPDARIEALEFLYQNARGQRADTLADAAREIARETAAETEEAIKEAAVASARTVVPAASETPAARIAADWDKLNAPFVGGEDGWNV